MRRVLTSCPHIDNIKIEAEIEIKNQKLYLQFSLLGSTDIYTFESFKAIKRADNLWEKSCFELFIANRISNAYWEINISSTGEWNLYQFDAYKQGMREIELTTQPLIQTQQDQDSFTISFELDIAELNLSDSLNINLATILLTKENSRTFWTINPVEKPDFHNQNGFINF